jgi:hypothetical protein
MNMRKWCVSEWPPAFALRARAKNRFAHALQYSALSFISVNVLRDGYVIAGSDSLVKRKIRKVWNQARDGN